MSRQLYSEALNELFSRVFFSERTAIEVNREFPASVLDFPLRLNEEETLNVMPRLATITVKRIARGAISGNLNDMLTLSMMYSVGLGVPESRPHSMSWANFSTMGSGPLEFKTAERDLRDHVEQVDGEYAYPDVLDKAYRSMIPSIQKADISELPADTYMLSPLLAGLRLFAVYRVHMLEDRSYCYLYDVRVGGLTGESIGLELAGKLNIPNYIGSHGSHGEDKRLVQPDYIRHMDDYLKTPTNYLVVAGTLTVPKSMKKHIRQVLPSMKTASDLFDYFVSTAGKTRRPIRNMPEYDTVKERLAKVRSRIRAVKDGTEHENLRAEFNQLKKDHKLAKRKGRFEESAHIKERSQAVKRMARMIRNGEAIPLLEHKVVKLQGELEELESQNEEFKAEQYAEFPEYLFQFIASDLYHGRKGKATHVPLGQHINRHLQAIGFDVVNTNLFDEYHVLRTKGGSISPKAYSRTVSKFEERFPDHKVTGIIARPVEMGSVKKPQKLPVYIVTSE